MKNATIFNAYLAANDEIEEAGRQPVWILIAKNRQLNRRRRQRRKFAKRIAKALATLDSLNDSARIIAYFDTADRGISFEYPDPTIDRIPPEDTK